MKSSEIPMQRLVLGGKFTLDIPQRGLFRGLDRIHLTSKPFDLLVHLVRNQGRVVAREELLDAVWGGHPNDNVVEQAMRQVRRALDEDKADPQFIHTLPGHGYCFVAPVEDAANGRGGPEDAAPRSDGRRLNRRRLLVGGAAAAVLTSAGGLARFLTHRSGLPLRAGVVGNALCAWDETGSLLWKHAFSEVLRTDYERSAIQDRSQVVDLAGDGGREVIFWASFPRNEGVPDTDELYCFSSRGKILWQFRPQLAMRFGQDRFTGPWGITSVRFVAGARPTVYAAGYHFMWRPGYVVGIDISGKVSLKFQSAGNVDALHHSVNPSGSYLLAGGINNEYNAASLAVLREDAPPSCSPQTRGTRFECLDGPGGQPDRYFLFPPTELNVASGESYNRVTSIQDRGDLCFVTTQEIGQKPPAEAIYRFTSALEPADVTFTDIWAAWHRRYESEGKLNHRLADCPQLKRPVRVRRWDQKSGWTTVDVPFAAGVGPGAYHA